MADRQATRSILMTADPVGGVWQYTLELCGQLKKLSVNVSLATMGRCLTDVERAAVGDLANVQLFESNYKLEWMNDPWADLETAGQWLLDLERQTSPDLVHLNQYCYGALPWQSPCLVVGHSCVYSWFEAVKGAPPGREWDCYKQTVRRGLQYADAVTAPSRSMLAALARHYGTFAATEPIYNGRSSALFVPAKKEPLVLTAGRLWDEAKNAAILQTVAAQIPWPICAAGDWTGPDGKNKRAADLISLGPLDSAILAAWFGRAAIFIAPARYEPFGLSVLEAALSGCALILGDIASLREIWDDAAVFVAPDERDTIAAALLGLIRDTPLRAELSRRARERALYFTPERMAGSYLELYEALLANDNCGRAHGLRAHCMNGSFDG